MCHSLQVYWSQSLLSVQRVVVSPRFQQEGVYLVWGSHGKTAWGWRRLHERWHPAFRLQNRGVCSENHHTEKTSISQINAWETWFSARWGCEQIWRAVMSLFCPHRSLEPVTPGTMQRKGKPAFAAVLATWGAPTKGWESSIVIPIEHCVAPLYPAKRHGFCCWTAPCVAVKNYLQLSLHKN